MGRRVFSTVVALSAMAVALGLWLAEKQPPCVDWMDGPCSPDYSAFGLHFFLFWLGAVALAVEGLALLGWTFMKRRRRPRRHAA